MLHTDAAQVRLQRLRTIVENKKVLGYGLVETLRLQTLRYIQAYIFTRKLINKYSMTSFSRSAQQKFRVLFLPDLGCCRVLLDFQLVLVLTRVRKAWTGEVGLQVQPEPSVRFCPQDGKEDRSPKKSVKIQEQGLARHSIHNFTILYPGQLYCRDSFCLRWKATRQLAAWQIWKTENREEWECQRCQSKELWESLPSWSLFGLSRYCEQKGWFTRALFARTAGKAYWTTTQEARQAWKI